MAEVVRRMKANKRLEETPCAWCKEALMLGDDTAVCEACDTVHHAHCWDEHDGCGEKTCVNAPFKVAPEPKPAEVTRQLGYFEKECPHCKAAISKSATMCPRCRRYTESPDGIFPEEQKTLPSEARNALIIAIVGFFIFGIILGPLAIRNGNRAKELIRNDLTLKGEGIATAAVVMGWIDVIGWGLVICINLMNA